LLSSTGLRTLTALISTALLSAPALAQGPACPPGDLLAGVRPVAARHVAGDAARATDGRVAPEGAAWDVPPAVVLDGADASITWDLGTPREIRALLLQADANARYPISVSLDGREFVPLG